MRHHIASIHHCPVWEMLSGKKLWTHKPGRGWKFKSKAKQALIFDYTLSIISVIYIMTAPLFWGYARSDMRHALCEHGRWVAVFLPFVNQLLLFSCKPRNLNQHMGVADKEVSVFPRSRQRVGSRQEVLQVDFKQTRLLNGFVLRGQTPGIINRMTMRMSVVSSGPGFHRLSQNSCGTPGSAPWSSNGQKEATFLCIFSFYLITAN